MLSIAPPTLFPITSVPQQTPRIALSGNQDLIQRKGKAKEKGKGKGIGKKIGTTNIYFWNSDSSQPFLHFFFFFIRRAKQPVRQWDGFCASLESFLGLKGPKKDKGSALKSILKEMQSFIIFWRQHLKLNGTQCIWRNTTFLGYNYTMRCLIPAYLLPLRKNSMK